MRLNPPLWRDYSSEGFEEGAMAAEHVVTKCDECGAALTPGRATCVTNAATHLHADRQDCVDKLEQRLGTYA